MALARKIAYNVVFNSALKVTSTVFIALLSIRLITGYLGQEGFGEYATVLAFFAFLGPLVTWGLPISRLGKLPSRRWMRRSFSEKSHPSRSHERLDYHYRSTDSLLVPLQRIGQGWSGGYHRRAPLRPIQHASQWYFPETARDGSGGDGGIRGEDPPVRTRLSRCPF